MQILKILCRKSAVIWWGDVWTLQNNIFLIKKALILGLFLVSNKKLAQFLQYIRVERKRGG
jgi:hypothetical protein